MRTFTDAEIIARVESHAEGFIGWMKGEYSIWVRSNADKYDEFDDKNFIFSVSANGATPKFVMMRNGTTNAGSYGLKHFDDYNPLGCAVLKSNYMVYGYAVKGFHKRNPLNPAYIQAKVWPYCRDNNRNEKAEEIGPLYWDRIGANDHRAGLFSRWIRNWSTACMVTAIRAQYNKFLSYMKSKGYPALNQVILKEW